MCFWNSHIQATGYGRQRTHWHGQAARQSGAVLHYPRRPYSPSLGRWLSSDPIKEKGGLNLYNFVKNNPIMWWDYLGLARLDLDMLYLGEMVDVAIEGESLCDKEKKGVIKIHLTFISNHSFSAVPQSDIDDFGEVTVDGKKVKISPGKEIEEGEGEEKMKKYTYKGDISLEVEQCPDAVDKTIDINIWWKKTDETYRSSGLHIIQAHWKYSCKGPTHCCEEGDSFVVTIKNFEF